MISTRRSAACQVSRYTICAMKRKYELKSARTSGRDAAADRRGDGRPAHVGRPGAHHDLGDRGRRRRRAAHGVRAFPGRATLFVACSAHWQAEHPRPDPGRWLELDDPEERLRRVLSELYAWYAGVETDLDVIAQNSGVPAHTQISSGRPRSDARARRRLARGWPRRRAVRAAVGHALEFETWRSLVRRQGLTRPQAVEAMVQLVASVQP